MSLDPMSQAQKFSLNQNLSAPESYPSPDSVLSLSDALVGEEESSKPPVPDDPKSGKTGVERVCEDKWGTSSSILLLQYLQIDEWE